MKFSFKYVLFISILALSLFYNEIYIIGYFYFWESQDRQVEKFEIL